MTGQMTDGRKMRACVDCGAQRLSRYGRPRCRPCYAERRVALGAQEPLTHRQAEADRYLRSGLSVADIAERMEISGKRVYELAAQIRRKREAQRAAA